MWCVCAQLYMDQSKRIFDHFICFWKWFLSLFVFMFSFYFIFHCLNLFYVEKQVLEFFTTQLATRQLRNPIREFIQKIWRLTRNSWKFLRLNLATRPVTKRPKIKGFLWETCFKHLPSFYKPLFQYFYIKTQSIWIVFHSINISKVIINYFH